LRDAAGNPLWAGASLRSTGKIDQFFAPDAVEFVPLRTWRSPRSGITYPVEWRLRVAGQEWLINALMDDQELDSRRSVGTIYWEGAVRVSRNGQASGEGYLELTGYGEKIRIG
jgi:predicted secreted hydrolase